MVLIDPTGASWAIPEALGAAAVVVHCGTSPAGAVHGALHRGARAVLCRDDLPRLPQILSLVANGLVVVGPACAPNLTTPGWMPAGTSGEMPRLSGREQQILALIARGRTVRQTAGLLGIAAKTVENTQSRLFRKFGARNRTETLLRAYQLGLVDLEPADVGSRAGAGEGGCARKSSSSRR